MKGQKIVGFVFLTQLLKVQRLDCLHCPTPNSCEAAYAPLLHKFISLCFLPIRLSRVPAPVAVH